MNIFEMIGKRSAIASSASNAAPTITQGGSVESPTAGDSAPLKGHLSCAFVVDSMGEIEAHELFINNCDNQLDFY